MVKSAWLLLFGGLVCVKGLWNGRNYFQGKGAKFYHMPYYETMRKMSDFSWYQRYLLWDSTLLWVGIKGSPNRVERLYLFILSVLQVLVGAVMVSLSLS